MSEPTIAKKIINELMETMEDVATAVIGAVLLIFTVGAWYGSVYVNTPQLWYPFYLFTVLVILKLLKDLFIKTKKK